jgi:ABC-2 type transport system ATP-binding protein/lipopolysaccharide transport system ATP-binding protein
LSDEGKEKHVFHPDEGMTISMDVTSYSKIDDFVFGIGIFNSQGICCYGTNTQLDEYEAQSVEGEGRVLFRIDRMNLINGTYYLDVAVHKKDGYPYDYHRNLYSFMISSSCKDVGISRPDHSWEFSEKIKITPAKKN